MINLYWTDLTAYHEAEINVTTTSQGAVFGLHFKVTWPFPTTKLVVERIWKWMCSGKEENNRWNWGHEGHKVTFASLPLIDRQFRNQAAPDWSTDSSKASLDCQWMVNNHVNNNSNYFQQGKITELNKLISDQTHGHIKDTSGDILYFSSCPQIPCAESNQYSWWSQRQGLKM